MEIQPQRPTVKGPAETFTGDVWVDMIAQGEPPSLLRVGIVRFAPGAHTAWHRHVNGQTLHILDGYGLVQSRGGQVLPVSPGDTIYTPPGSGTGMARPPAAS
jgi:quercetin dioxygenase-like cupin family protein